MDEFIKTHGEQVIGILGGWDRVIFRGTLRKLSYVEGLMGYLWQRQILLKDFGAFSQRVTGVLAKRCEALAVAAGRPYRYVASAQVRKEQLVQRILAEHPVEEGLVCVLRCVEPCQSFEVHRNRQTRRLELVSAPRKCLFFYLYYRHRDLGLIFVRIQSWLPLEVQVYVNGRSYLGRRLTRAGIAHTQVDNTFTYIADLPRAQQMLDELTARDWSATLWRLVRPVMKGILQSQRLLADLAGDYYWTMRQSEFATDVMFKDATYLRDVYPALCRHAMERLSSPDMLRFLGQQQPGKRDVTSSCQRRREGVRVKHCVGNNSVKMYDKAQTVLRIETTVNDPGMFESYRQAQGDPASPWRWRTMRKAVADIARRAEVSAQANAMYLEALAGVHRPAPVRQVLDPVSQRQRVEGQPVRALRPVSPEDAAFFAAVLHGEHLIRGFTNRQLQRLLFEQPPDDPAEARRRSAQTSHRLRLLRHHGLIRKVGAKRLYRITAKGHSVMGLALSLRGADTVELLAA